MQNIPQRNFNSRQNVHLSKMPTKSSCLANAAELPSQSQLPPVLSTAAVIMMLVCPGPHGVRGPALTDLISTNSVLTVVLHTHGPEDEKTRAV